jgi:3-hydroxyacyl-CoA dehydrogenase
MIRSLREMVGHNQLGIKTGKGFYDYKGLTRSSGISGQDAALPDQLRQKTVKRLWHRYEESLFSMLESGVCSREELIIHLQDYLGIDRDPLTLIDL